MTADHWGFVLAAYGIAAIALGAYWRHLCRRERELTERRGHAAPKAAHPRTNPVSPVRS
jgi:hypothetical protein